MKNAIFFTPTDDPHPNFFAPQTIPGAPRSYVKNFVTITPPIPTLWTNIHTDIHTCSLIYIYIDLFAQEAWIFCRNCFVRCVLAVHIGVCICVLFVYMFWQKVIFDWCKVGLILVCSIVFTVARVVLKFTRMFRVLVWFVKTVIDRGSTNTVSCASRSLAKRIGFLLILCTHHCKISQLN